MLRTCTTARAIPALKPAPRILSPTLNIRSSQKSVRGRSLFLRLRIASAGKHSAHATRRVRGVCHRPDGWRLKQARPDHPRRIGCQNQLGPLSRPSLAAAQRRGRATALTRRATIERRCSSQGWCDEAGRPPDLIHGRIAANDVIRRDGRHHVAVSGKPSAVISERSRVSIRHKRTRSRMTATNNSPGRTGRCTPMPRPIMRSPSRLRTATWTNNLVPGDAGSRARVRDLSCYGPMWKAPGQCIACKCAELATLDWNRGSLFSFFLDCQKVGGMAHER